ncbi:MAG: DUF1513 domain-containing protein [Pseudomonadota bacterium]
MAIDRQRRRSLRWLAALPPLGVLPNACVRENSDRSPRLIGCCALREGGFAAVVLDQAWRELASIPLAARGHGIAVAPQGHLAVVLGRRPSRTATVIDLRQLRAAHTFDTPRQRHLFGHGFFGPNGGLFYTTENDFEAPTSVLGVYDVNAGFRRLGEMITHGIGAHEAVLLGDGAAIAVANGGIETHPDYPRRKLNLANMRPSLAYLRAADGALLEQVQLPAKWHQVSLRHLAQASDGSVWVGGQDEGGGGGGAPLVLRHRRGDAALQVIGDSQQTSALAGYVGSVSAHSSRPIVAVTSPRGNRVNTYEATTGRLLDATSLVDVCGVARSSDGMIVSTGEGEVRSVQAHRGATHRTLRWDNHLSAIEVRGS